MMIIETHFYISIVNGEGWLMTMDKLDNLEQTLLLGIAREALEISVQSKPLPEINLSQLPPNLQKPGASFVTLTIQGDLRGCIGTLEAYQPLALDVQTHAVDAGMHDPRFPALRPSELETIQIEVSVLSPKTPLTFAGPQDLINKLRVNLDGVVLQDGYRRATFLPQVWEKLPHPEQFLSHLCLKMGASANLWQNKPLKVYTYQVQEFQE
jgi:AmmeMemoRadiSam system protein A